MENTRHRKPSIERRPSGRYFSTAPEVYNHQPECRWSIISPRKLNRKKCSNLEKLFSQGYFPKTLVWNSGAYHTNQALRHLEYYPTLTGFCEVRLLSKPFKLRLSTSPKIIPVINNSRSQARPYMSGCPEQFQTCTKLFRC